MDWEAIRTWLISQGIPAEELDKIEEPPVIADLGQTVLLALENGEATAALVMMLVEQIAALEGRIAKLEGGAAGA